jgi:hypothetical protein
MTLDFLLYRSCLAYIFLLLTCKPALAAPPFKTDDPQPLDYLHWEFYIASMQQFMSHESNATSPHVEVNYGIISNAQMNLVAPLACVHTNEGTHFG